MKKIILLIIGIMFIIPNKVLADNTDSYVTWTLDMDVVAHQVKDGVDHMTNLAMITTNGVSSYCIEPGIEADKDSLYNSTYNIEDTPIGDIDVKKLSLIGYYGYGYTNHNEKEYYMATQELIWRLMGVENAYWTKGKYGDIIDISKYKDDILNLVNAHDKVPDFNFSNKYIVGEEISVSDNNNVLNEFEILSSNGNALIEANNIKIKVIDGDNSFILKRKKQNKITRFYYKSGFQTIASFGFPYDVQQEYNINYDYGKIIVNKLDSDTKENVAGSKESSLEGAQYALYDEMGNELQIKETNKEGVAVFEKLESKLYTVKEIKPSCGYTLDESNHKTFVNKYNNVVNLKSYEKIIKGQILITKIFDDNSNGLMVPEEGITFDVYDIDNILIGSYTTDDNGKVFFDLVYGTYLIKQRNSPEGINKVEDFVVIIDKDNVKKEYVLVNKKIEEEMPEEEIPEEETLPDTGKNINFIYALLIFIILGIYYEKKHN